MSVVRPFGARVVRQEWAAQNVSQMLDALPAAERLAALDVHRGPPRAIDPDAYAESAPALYVYRLQRGDDQHVGVVADVSAAAFVDGQVRGHEAVQPDRVEGLVDYFTAAGARSELVALLHRPGPGGADAVAETLRSEPMTRFTGPDGWEQTVWRVPESAAEVLSAELSEAVHYIADGHHRVAASLRVWELAGRPPTPACCASSTRSTVCDCWPSIAGSPVPSTLSSCSRLLADAFDVRDIADPRRSGGQLRGVRRRPLVRRVVQGRAAPGRGRSRRRDPERRGVGTTARQRPDAASRLEIVRFPTETELTKACDEDGGALFVLRPPTLDQLTEVADRGEVMPPKTTYFDPKPYAGIFLR